MLLKDTNALNHLNKTTIQKYSNCTSIKSPTPILSSRNPFKFWKTRTMTCRKSTNEPSSRRIRNGGPTNLILTAQGRADPRSNPAPHEPPGASGGHQISCGEHACLTFTALAPFTHKTSEHRDSRGAPQRNDILHLAPFPHRQSCHLTCLQRCAWKRIRNIWTGRIHIRQTETLSFWRECS